MFFTAFSVGTLSLVLESSLPLPICLGIAFPAALTGTVVELISKHGDDTVTVPVAISFVVCLLSSLVLYRHFRTKIGFCAKFDEFRRFLLF